MEFSPTDNGSPLSPATYGAEIPRSPSRQLFKTAQEHHYFRTFCSHTARQLSGLFDSGLWSRLMLQACEAEPSIRHAVVAIGALNLTAVSPSKNEVGTLRHQFAFRQYSKALCLMRRDVAGGRHDLRTTLIACLLFYSFESYHGYHESAVNQVYSGLRMIREWTRQYYPSPVEGWVRTKIGSEAPNVVEDDILRAFGSLEVQVMSYADGRTADVHEHYRHCGQASIDEMPALFTTLAEARSLLELVIRRSMHWLASTMHMHDFSSASSTTKQAEMDPLDGREPSSLNLSLFFDVDPSYSERSATLREYERWDNAFQPLLRHSRLPQGREGRLLAETLRLHWLAGYMSIASNNCSTSLSRTSKRFSHELGELVRIARMLLTHQKEKASLVAGYSFDMQIIVPLMTVGWVYRHRKLREEAITLLMDSPRKEGVWDGIVVGKIMRWLAGVEEEVMVNGARVGWRGGAAGGDADTLDEDGEEEYVPEWAAARCIKMSFETRARTAMVSCLQPVPGSRVGEEVRREVVIPW